MTGRYLYVKIRSNLIVKVWVLYLGRYCHVYKFYIAMLECLIVRTGRFSWYAISSHFSAYLHSRFENFDGLADILQILHLR